MLSLIHILNTRNLLDQLLKSGQDLLQQKGAGGASSGLGGALGGLLDVYKRQGVPRVEVRSWRCLSLEVRVRGR